MAEVKELFSETSDVFRQLDAAKGKVASDIADQLSSIQTIINALNLLTTSESPQVLKTIQVNVYALRQSWEHIQIQCSSAVKFGFGPFWSTCAQCLCHILYLILNLFKPSISSPKMFFDELIL